MCKQLFVPPPLLPSLWHDTTEYEAATCSSARAQRVVFLIKEGTASKHAKGSHSNKGQIGVYKKSIICFECCRAPKLLSTQQAFMRLQYVLTISVGLHAVLDWFFDSGHNCYDVVSYCTHLLNIHVHIPHTAKVFMTPKPDSQQYDTGAVSITSVVSTAGKPSSCSNDSWCPKIWQSDWLDVRNATLVTLE